MWIQLIWMLVAAGLAALAIYFHEWIPAVIGVLAATLLSFWILVSTLWPSKPDRRCPRCGQDGLVKIRRGEPGVRCEHCSFVDENMHVAYLDDW